MRTLHVSLLVSVVLVFGVANGLVQADVILNPTSASDNGHYTVGSPDIYGASAYKTTDGTGLTNANLVDNGDPIPSSWPTNNCDGSGGGAGAAFWDGYASNVDDKVVTYTFATAVNITGGHFWQYGGDDASRSLKNADIYVSNTDVWENYTLAGTLAGYSQPTGTQDTGQDFSLTNTAANVRYIQLRNLTNWSGLTTGFCGFGEIRFVGTVPEPGTLILTATGLLGLLAYAWRKRK